MSDELTGNTFTDFFKNKVKDIAMSYAKPFLSDIKTAIANRDFEKLADVTKRLSAIVGYAEVGALIAAVFSDIGAGNYTAAIKDGVTAFEAIYALFPKPSPAPAPAPHMTVSGTAPTCVIDDVEAEVKKAIDSFLDFIDGGNAAKVKGTAPAGDGNDTPAQFGIIESAAILSLVWTGIQMIRARRQKKASGD